MEGAGGWLYLGEYAVWPSKHRLTIPPCVFDEYGILSRDGLGWWTYRDGADAIEIFRQDPNPECDIAKHATISDPGDGSATTFFTVPEPFRQKERDTQHGESDAAAPSLPERIRLSHDTTVHFVTDPESARGDSPSFYLYTLDALERSIEAGKHWVDEPRSLSRLLDSSASHLVDETARVEPGRDSTGDQHGTTQQRAGSLADRLRITENDVLDDFAVRRRTIEIEAIPRSIYDLTDFKYLLVRYGVEERIRNSPSADQSLVDNLNKLVDVQTSYSPEDESLVAEVPFCVHDRYSVQFKFCVDVADSDLLERVRGVFAQSPSCESASISDSLDDRVYMVHNEFRTTETARGFVNNVVYSK